LQENNILVDSAEMNSYKYYSFTLQDAGDVVNISFNVDSLHGDADLYLSRNNKFPTKVDYEKRSEKSLSYVPDEVLYSVSSQGDGIKLDGTYYVGVFSSQYSSFTILVKVHRNSSS
jgi:hypothetical protein